MIGGYFHISDEITTTNKYQVDESKWDAWNEYARRMFNFMYEANYRNQDIIFATDIFPLKDFPREYKDIVLKLINAANWNTAWNAADYVNIGISEDTTGIKNN